MMDTNMTDTNWGERHAARRVRRRMALRIATFAMVPSFGFGARYVVPIGNAANLATAAWIIAAAMSVLAIGWLLWRDADEIQRRRSNNALAAAAFVTLPLMPAARLGGKALGIADPALAIAWVGVVAILIAYAVQHVRG